MGNLSGELIRLRGEDDFTNGVIRWTDGTLECFTVEDEYRKEKVKGETCIPEGYFEVKYRKVESPMTIRYRNRYPWFTWHLEFQDVPNFLYVYIHVGNDDDDTDGCVLVNQLWDISDPSGRMGKSRPAYEKIYKKISEVLDRGDRVFINVINLIPEG